jgi:dTDP-glucose 4,6-dehydratase
MRIAVTGAAGFIGSHLVDRLLKDGHNVLGIDCETYAANERNLESARQNKKFVYLKAKIESEECTFRIEQWGPDVIFNLAAESHVDNSIKDPLPFLRSNVEGTLNLLEYVRRSNCRFFQISTDEVYGHLVPGQQPFNEGSRISPRSPYASSKASADMFVRSYIETYGINAIVTRCSNNFGHRQHQEKLIPTIVRSCVNGSEIPVYGKGENIRDWIWVEDHVDALVFLLSHGSKGHVYNIGSRNEWKNLEIVELIRRMIPGEHKVSFVTDRLGHDFRYAIDNSKMRLLGWEPTCTTEKFIDFLQEEVELLRHRL